MNNLNIWNRVAETPPSVTKVSTMGGRQETSINGTYMVKKATEIFGMIGIGWGYEVLEERFDEGHAIAFDADGNVTNNSLTHTIKLQLWFKDPDSEEKGTIISYGHTPYMRMTKNGIMTDGEAPKKSLTDAVKKALSQLGFCADIFMGLYDDRDYIENLANQEAIEKADDKDAERERQQKEFQEWFGKNTEAMEKAASMNELQGVYKHMVRKLKNRNRDDLILGVTDLKDAVKEKLEKANETS